MDSSRLKVALEVRRLRARVKSAELREQRALERAGARVFLALVTRGNGGEVAGGDALDVSTKLRREQTNEGSGTARDVSLRLQAIERQSASLRSAMDASLETDRRDFAGASELTRWAVIARGACERVILRDRARSAAREQRMLERELGRMAFDGAHPEIYAHVPEADATEITAARSEAHASMTLQKELCAPYGGDPLPPLLRTIARETQAFSGYVWKQFSSKIFLRAPAIAGLIVGWWLGRTFTDSALESLFHDIGFGGRKGLSPSTMSWLAFWLPIIAAALCSYLGAFIAARVERRYGPQPAVASESK